MNRRGFLSALIAAGTAAAIDPEKLLWEPGRKLISIPKPGPMIVSDGWASDFVGKLRIGDKFTIPGFYAVNPLKFHQLFIVTAVHESGHVRAELKPVPWGPEDFQAAAVIARGSSHRGIE
jgi:hypothetical protein